VCSSDLRWLLLPIGVVSIGSFLLSFFLTAKQPKTILSHLAGVLGITLTGPSSYYIVRGQLDATALVLWVLNILFFGSCVFYVHMRIQALAARRIKWSPRDRITCGGLNLVCHLVMIVILLFLVLEHPMPALALLPFVPMTINAVWGTVKLASEANLRILGFTLLGHSVAFMALLFILLGKVLVERMGIVFCLVLFVSRGSVGGQTNTPLLLSGLAV
jgi:hypothetical protein